MQKGFEVVNLHGTASGVIAVPVIGENGNWWIGNEDTGIKAQGEPGPQGEKGEAGSPGVDPAELAALKTEIEILNGKLAGLSDLEPELLFTGSLTVPSNSSGSTVCELPKDLLDYKFIYISIGKATGSGTSFVPTACIDTSYPSGTEDNKIYNNFVSHSANTGILTMARVLSSTSIAVEGLQYGWSGSHYFEVNIYGVSHIK